MSRFQRATVTMEMPKMEIGLRVRWARESATIRNGPTPNPQPSVRKKGVEGKARRSDGDVSLMVPAPGLTARKECIGA